VKVELDELKDSLTHLNIFDQVTDLNDGSLQSKKILRPAINRRTFNAAFIVGMRGIQRKLQHQALKMRGNESKAME
jgi:hypothetical protein